MQIFSTLKNLTQATNLAIMLFFACFMLFSKGLIGQSPLSQFYIRGEVQGFSDGTIIYLNDVTHGNYQKIDSAIINANKFNFTGNLNHPYLKSSITTADYRDRVTFWLEKGTTSFKANKGSFGTAIINSGQLQKKWDILVQMLDTTTHPISTEYSFIKNNPSTIIAAYSLAQNCNTWSKDTVSTLFNSLSKEVQQSEFGQKTSLFLALNKELKVGNQFFDFEQQDTSGTLVKLSDIKNKYILLEFWGSWCGPCREENPYLVQIYNEFKGKGFEIVGVAAETNKNQWMNAIKEDGLSWFNLTDLKGSNNEAVLIYGINGYPSNFMIDRNGILVAKNLYGDDLRNWLLNHL